uniref:FG-GAP repeat-containing protein n=1 Tax=Ananas comosus var. bracteatus TaxID=296719 RepID=A0A6V7QKB0_ANACO|nr:unnamed protein product [Ananas comosus var. bracteatus]
MRKRDLGILLLAAFAIFFSLQHEGDFSFKEAWFHLSDEYPIKYEAERLPPPVVVDLNGDGKSEVLVATHDAKIQVSLLFKRCLEPHNRRVDEGFSEARVLAEVSLLPDKVRIASGRRPVAMAAGVVDRSYKHGEIRKQVFVVVTSGWSVMCFDHNLKKLWENNLQEDFPHGAHHREIAISISNYTLKHGDAGLVIVGGRMEMQHHTSADLFEEFMMSENDGELHHRIANEKEVSGNGTVDLRHFAFYAFAGRTGTLRWSRKSENIQAQPSDASMLIPQHNYKLDVHALNSRHPGEFECREFRESILGVMPHHWDRREDTSLHLAHFRRHKRKSLKKTPGKTVATTLHKPVEHNPLGKDRSNKIAKAIGKAADYAGSAKSKKKSLYIPTITNHTQVWWLPNVVVAHEKEGIEAVHLASGRTICKWLYGSAETVLGSCDLRCTSERATLQCFYLPLQSLQSVPAWRFCKKLWKTFDTSTLEVATPILVGRDDGHKHREGAMEIRLFDKSRRGNIIHPCLHGHDAIWRWQFILTSIELPAPPTHALLLEDFSGDGLTDIILVTSGGVYGFVQTASPAPSSSAHSASTDYR